MLLFHKTKTTLFLFSLLFNSVCVDGQELLATKVDEAIVSTSDRTYVSFGQGLGQYKTPYKLKRLNPLVFEGQISPNFFLKLSKNRNTGVAFFPKIVIRMYDEKSLPVKTPSYMPNMLFYHQIRWPFQKKLYHSFKPENQLLFITYRISHHSNGQNGSYFINESDSVNYTNGNFSSNSVEIALSWSAIDSNEIGKSFMNGRIAYERQLDLEREQQMKNTYYYDKLTLETHIIYSEKIKVYITYSFMWGTRAFGVRNSLDVFLVVKPSRRLTNFSVFLRGYAGPDYYNIYYENKLRAMTVGIIADPLSIPVFKKRKKGT